MHFYQNHYFSKKYFLVIFAYWQLFSLNSNAQEVSPFTFGTDNSLEVVTWNLEWFPKNAAQTINYTAQFIEYMDADIIALQEIDNLTALEQLKNSLPEYESVVFFESLAYFYKPESITITSSYEIYSEANYWQAFPRSPLVIEFTYKNEDYILINNHLKCCGDGILDLDDNYDEETRRFSAITYLKTYIEYYFQGQNVLVVGDFNDELTDPEEHNVFAGFLNEPLLYKFTDYELATSTPEDWSYPSWPSHLDHILITQPLFDDYNREASFTETLNLEDYLGNGWPEYNQFVSDHRPVGLLLADANLDVSAHTKSVKEFYNVPNPIYTYTRFYFPSIAETGTLSIYDMNAKILFRKEIKPGQENLKVALEKLNPGVYMASLKTSKTVYRHKIVVQ